MSLPAFLKSLFGGGDPDALARARLGQWQAWLAPIPGPLAVGTDPAYDDDFLALREEIAKLGGLDDALILAASERLLRNVCKDLRPAAYYAFARLRMDGAKGFADGLELIAALLDTYREAVLPQRAESRKAALEWLNGERFRAFLESGAGERGDLQRACSALVLIEQLVADWAPTARPDLRPLIGRFEALIESSEGGVPGMAAGATTGVQATATGAEIKQGEVGSARDLLDRAREMAVFLRRRTEGYLPACRLLRCIRWDTVATAPPHDGRGWTRLPPPRPELHQHLKRLLLQQQWHELLERVELAFAEGANHFWLDLQFYAWQAQGSAGPDYSACQDILLTDFAQTCDRLSGVERLCFSDGTPFAEDGTLEWIARYAVIRNLEAGEALAPPSTGGGDADWRATELQAADLAATQGLEAAFQWIAALPPVAGARNRFMRNGLMARLAEHHGRSEIALHLLSELERDIEQFRLDRWDPALAFEIKVQQLRVLRQRAQRKDVDKGALNQRIDALLGTLTALDPVRALALSATPH